MTGVKLNSGDLMPPIGFGTWQILLSGKASRAVEEALKVGYRLIDTARIYGNERGVGLAIRQSDIPRKDIFVTTKLWNNSHGRQESKKAFNHSLSRLGLDYVDLYLIHWPSSGRLLETWQALEEINKTGKAKNIGVSNYNTDHLKEAIKGSKTIPAVNQIEFHPFVYARQKPVFEYCQKHGIVIEAYSPLAHGHGIDNPTVSSLAAKYQKTNAQVMIRWCIQHGTIPIPKSSHPRRMHENIDVFDFELSKQDMTQLNNL
jgi:diketogulonate reductase-like aldo/keto reductase